MSSVATDRCSKEESFSVVSSSFRQIVHNRAPQVVETRHLLSTKIMRFIFSLLCLAYVVQAQEAKKENLKGWSPTITPTYWGGLWAPTPEPTHYGGWAGSPTASSTSLHCQNGHTPIVPSKSIQS